MQAHIDAVRAPHREVLEEELATADSLLYRRGNFNGTFDQLIVDALRAELDAQIALSPGFRWGTTVLPGEAITMDRLLDQTCMTYPETYVREMSGAELRNVLESVADNLFNPTPTTSRAATWCAPAASATSWTPRRPWASACRR
jgi:sulfur-oxidizing protein SoxB